jgi:hypothetical protein
LTKLVHPGVEVAISGVDDGLRTMAALAEEGHRTVSTASSSKILLCLKPLAGQIASDEKSPLIGVLIIGHSQRVRAGTVVIERAEHENVVPPYAGRIIGNVLWQVAIVLRLVDPALGRVVKVEIIVGTSGDVGEVYVDGLGRADINVEVVPSARYITATDPGLIGLAGSQGAIGLGERVVGLVVVGTATAVTFHDDGQVTQVKRRD